jgi:hypothetical protein
LSPKDPYIHEKFTRERSADLKLAQGILRTVSQGLLSDRSRKLATLAVGQHRIHNEAVAGAPVSVKKAPCRLGSPSNIGCFMVPNDRMKAILEKQAAADRAREAKAAQEAAAEKDEKALQSKVEQIWPRLEGVLTETIKSANAAMTGDRKLYVLYGQRAAGSMEVASVILSLENAPPNLIRRKCVVSVRPDGTIFVAIDGDAAPKKNYRLDASTATHEQIEGIVYDFLELNI